MPLYINGIEYGGMAMNGYEINGAINGVPLFSSDSPSPQPKPSNNKGVLIIKCMDSNGNKQIRPTQKLTVTASDHISLMDLVHKGILTVLKNYEWFSGDLINNNFDPYDFPLKPGQTLELNPRISSL